MTICQLYDTYAWDIQPKRSLQKTNLPWMRLVLTQTISYLDASYAGVMLRTSGFIIPHLPPTKSRESTFGWRFWSLRTRSITGSWTSATLKRISNCKWSQSILLETHSNQIFKANYLNFHDNMQDLNFKISAHCLVKWINWTQIHLFPLPIHRRLASACPARYIPDYGLFPICMGFCVPDFLPILLYIMKCVITPL